MPKYTNYLANAGISNEAFDFLESSKMKEYELIDFTSRLPIIMGTPYYMDQIINHTSELGFCEKVPLRIGKSENMPLMEVQKKRKSYRNYDPTGISFDALSDLLNLSYCVTNHPDKSQITPSRNIASPGALFPIDLYLINQCVEGLQKGVYHYNLNERSLELISDQTPDAELDEKVKHAFMIDHQTDINRNSASGYLVLGATLNRSCFKYQDKGVRFALIDTGAIIHAIYLACASLDIHCCAFAGYVDDLVARLIGYEGNSRTVTGVVAFGKPISS